jgi:hypothetical protein
MKEERFTYSERSEGPADIDELEGPAGVHERGHLLETTGYMGFKVASRTQFAGGMRMVVVNDRGHRLQADGEHPGVILNTLVQMIDAYRE